MSVVLDASALLALLAREPGAERVALAIMDRPAMSAVNVAEIAAKLADRGVSEAEVRESLDALEIEVVAFDADAVFASAALRRATKDHGLSLGDRACLALAHALDRPALTCDASWAALDLPARVELAR